MARYAVKVAKSDLWSAIRNKCKECSGGSTKEVKLCPIEDCPLYLYRFGKASTNGENKKEKEVE